MAETRKAIDDIDAIVAVPGVDAVFFGPNDLSFSMGHPAQMKHPDVVAAIEHGVDRALAAGVAPGLLVTSADEFHHWAKRGARYLPMVITGLIGGAMRAAVAGARATRIAEVRREPPARRGHVDARAAREVGELVVADAARRRNSARRGCAR